MKQGIQFGFLHILNLPYYVVKFYQEQEEIIYQIMDLGNTFLMTKLRRDGLISSSL